MARTTVAVVFGGRSSEHAISCVSAGAIIGALDPARYDVVRVGISRDGQWALDHRDPADLAIVDGVLPEAVPAGDLVAPLPAEAASGYLASVDVIFPVLHGPWGEDGTVQGLFELAGVPYVGSGVMSSSVTMDKAAMKSMLRAAGLPVGPYEVITDRQWRLEQQQSLARVEALGFPVFVKPARAGSSMGISKVASRDGLRSAIDEARLHDPKVVVEAAIADGREIECGVITDDTGAARASRCAEIVVHGEHEFYDFTAKYLDASADLVVPAQLEPAVEAEVQALACRAFEALGCEGLARADFFVTPSGILINELNTMPGFTPSSMFPRMWAASGVDYPTLVSHLVDDALRRGTGLR